MPFRLSSQSKIVHLIERLREAEQAGAKLPNDVRTLLSLSAHALDECRSHMMATIESLESAVRLRAGAMDSLRRHEEMARDKNLAMEEQIRFLGELLNVPASTVPASKPANDEVI